MIGVKYVPAADTAVLATAPPAGPPTAPAPAPANSIAVVTFAMALRLSLPCSTDLSCDSFVIAINKIR